MAPFIYGVRNNIHIIDLAQTVPMLHRALQAVSDTVAGGGRVLFVGTKRQAAEPITAAAKRSAQYYVNARWLGGMLTNWKTISQSIQRLRELEQLLAGEAQGLTKKERLTLTRERDKLEKALGGIKDMGGVPDLLFVIDTNKETIAIQEANRLNIPVAAIVDSNCDPGPHHLPDPGQRRCRPRDHALLRPHRARRDRRHLARPGRRRRRHRRAGGGRTSRRSSKRPTRRRTAPTWPTPRRSSRRPADAATKAGSSAAAPRRRSSTAPDGEPDDLKKITGVGPVLERKLRDLGVTQLRPDRRLHRRGHRQGRRGAQLQGPRRPRRLGRPGEAAAQSAARR